MTSIQKLRSLVSLLWWLTGLKGQTIYKIFIRDLYRRKFNLFGQLLIFYCFNMFSEKNFAAYGPSKAGVQLETCAWIIQEQMEGVSTEFQHALFI